MRLHIFWLVLVPCAQADDQQGHHHHQALRKRRSGPLNEPFALDLPISETIEPVSSIIYNESRDLSSIEECRQTTDMEVPLVPANVNSLLRNNDNDGVPAITTGDVTTTTRQQATPSVARLTFCLNRIFLDLTYVLNVGTLITDLDIVCPSIAAPVQFLEPNFVLPVIMGGGGSSNTNSQQGRFFVSGTYPGQVLLHNDDILKILADGENCEFKVRAYHFDDGLLVGQLRGNSFHHI